MGVLQDLDLQLSLLPVTSLMRGVGALVAPRTAAEAATSPKVSMKHHYSKLVLTQVTCGSM